MWPHTEIALQTKPIIRNETIQYPRLLFTSLGYRGEFVLLMPKKNSGQLRGSVYLNANTQVCYTYSCGISHDCVCLFYSHWLWLRIQNGRQAYLGADWIQLCTTLLPAFWCRQDSARSNICKYPQKGSWGSVPLCIWDSLFWWVKITEWDNGLYPNSRMPVSTISLLFIAFLFYFTSVLSFALQAVRLTKALFSCRQWFFSGGVWW